MSDLIDKFFRSGSIDYLSHFGTMWIGFNHWYKQFPKTNKRELDQVVTAVCGHPGIQAAVEDMKQSVNRIDDHISKNLDKLSRWTVTDQYGNQQMQGVNVTGDKLRLICNNRHVLTDFLTACLERPFDGSDIAVHGIRSFTYPARDDEQFKAIFQPYHSWMATSERMAVPYDAINDIPSLLSRLGITTWGRVLHHNLCTCDTSDIIYEYDDIMGQGYLACLTTMHQNQRQLLESKSPIANVAFGLYKLRCAYFHGDLDPDSEADQELGAAALAALRFLMIIIAADPCLPIGGAS